MPSEKVNHDVSHLSGRSASVTDLLATFAMVAIVLILCFLGGFSEDTEPVRLRKGRGPWFLG